MEFRGTAWIDLIEIADHDGAILQPREPAGRYEKRGSIRLWSGVAGARMVVLLAESRLRECRELVKEAPCECFLLAAMFSTE